MGTERDREDDEDVCGYCGRRFRVTVPGRQVVCATDGCPARTEWRGETREMARWSICSRHQVPDPDCDLCAVDAREAIGPELYDRKQAEAEEAGLHRCACGFEYYGTVSFCPRCSRNLPGVCPAHEFYRHSCLGCRRGVWRRP